MTNVLDLTASKLAAVYARGEVSPVEVMKEALEKAQQTQSTLNAFCAFDADGALEAAKASEQRWRRHAPNSLLDGVPVAIKDNVCTENMPTRYGSRTVESKKADWVDAPVTARLREAGALIFGKTTLCEYGYTVSSQCSLTGVTKNPWNVAHTCGGSSAGSAAAVAARICPVAVGTDGGGSVRVPAAWSGLHGFKSSFGRIPHFPRGAFAALSHIGPLTRSARDAAIFMDIATRPDSRDWYALPYNPKSYLESLSSPLTGRRIAYSETLGIADIEVAPAVLASLRNMRRLLVDMGAIVQDVNPPAIDRASQNHKILWTSFCARVAAVLQPEVREKLDPGFKELVVMGESVSREQLVNVLVDRGEVGRELNQFFGDYELVVCPTFPVTAPTLVEMETKSYFPAMTAWCNQAGLPAVSVPCGVDSAGLPIAMQLVGPQYGDYSVLGASGVLEGALNPAAV